jgi:hypothetical protein
MCVIAPHTLPRLVLLCLAVSASNALLAPAPVAVEDTLSSTDAAAAVAP